jgi:ubiquinol-cytochrome c reductase cytochrome b subunit
MSPWRRPGRWLDDRLGLSGVARHTLGHPIPAANAGRAGWLYVLGAATLVAFVAQIVTGVALATIYVPAPSHAHDSLLVLTSESRLGWLLRGMHFYGGSAMVLLVFLHMTRVFLMGSYKFPREVNWMTGAVLLGLTLAMAGTGQLLRWDQDGVWTVVVWAKFAERAPLIGEAFARFILGGDAVGGATLTRFFALHVFVFPALIMLVVAVHLYLVFYHGISEPPEAGRPVERATYRQRYAALLRTGLPYFPFGVWREAVAALAVVVSIVLLALVLGPVGPGAVPDPTDVSAAPKPDWFFLWYYTLIWLKPPALETLVMIYLPLGVGVILFLIPLLRPTGERSPSRRPWAIATVAIVVLTWATLTAFAVRPYWVPDFETRPLDPAVLGVGEGPVADGAALFHARGCQYCHRVLDEGGRYGPDLTRVAARLSREETAVRIVAGYRDMPAYRTTLSHEELDAIMAFLWALGAGSR